MVEAKASVAVLEVSVIIELEVSWVETSVVMNNLWRKLVINVEEKDASLEPEVYVLENDASVIEAFDVPVVDNMSHLRRQRLLS